MTHGYSLRSKAKGRQGQYSQSTGETLDHQVEGTSTPMAAARNSPARSESVVISATTTTQHRAEGPPEETREDIQNAAREREETRRIAEAVRIRREQIARGYEGELRALRSRIVALRRECELRVERARRKWERDWAIERGEVAIVVGDDREEGNMLGSDGEMAVLKIKTSQSAASAPSLSRSESNFQPPQPPPPPSPPSPTLGKRKEQNLSQQQQQQLQLHMGTCPLSLGMVVVGPSLKLEVTEEDENERRGGTPASTPGQGGQGHRKAQARQAQPLRRQPAQLMVIP